MATHRIGNIGFHVSPVSIMQCWVGTGWRATGSAKQIEEFDTFSREFFPFLIEQDCGMRIHAFCADAVVKMDEIIDRRELQTEFVLRFVQRLKGRLRTGNQERVAQLSVEYSERLQHWLDSAVGRCAGEAAAQIEEWGLQLPDRGLAAIGAFGSAVFGQYVHGLKAVCVQLDVIALSASPAAQFLETLFHEGIHAAIDRAMGADDTRSELTWLNELCAVLTSQEALRVAAAKFLRAAEKDNLNTALRHIRSTQKYGELAEAVARDTGNPLVALEAWKRVFALPATERHDYARERVIQPILHEAGWNVEFPYRYGNKSVTVFV